MTDYTIDKSDGFRLTTKAHQKSGMFAAAGIELEAIGSEPTYQAALTVALFKEATNLMKLSSSAVQAKLCTEALEELVYGGDLTKATYLIDKITKLKTWRVVPGEVAANC